MTEKSPRSSKKNSVLDYLRSAFEEFGKVTWPTKEQATLLTAIVVAVSLITGVLIGAFDLGLTELYQLALEKIAQ